MGEKKADETKALSKLLATLTHELKTPLNSILSLTEVLSSEIDGTLGSEQKRQVEMIRNNGEQLLEMITELLSYSSISYRAHFLHNQSFKLEPFLETTLEGLRSVAAQKRVTLDVNLQDIPEDFILDKTYLRQIVNNLVSNAIKFSPEGSTVSFDASVRSGMLEVLVVDQGHGIPFMKLHHIFDELYQVSDENKADSVGLGLALVRASIEGLGGELEVKSEDGRGTLFRLCIPEAEQSQAKGRAVVIDSDKTIHTTLKACLAKERYEVQCFVSLTDAISFMENTVPNVVFADSELVSGAPADLRESMKGLSVENRIPIFLMTVEESDHLKSLQSSILAYDILLKPFGVEELISKLQKIE